MMYFPLEDVPDEDRSKVNFIHLLAVCKSQSLKVEIPESVYFYSSSMLLFFHEDLFDCLFPSSESFFSRIS